MLIQKITKFGSQLPIRFYFAQDFSHVYDGITTFEDTQGLGEDCLMIRNQALEFAKKKLAPFAQ